MANRAKRAKKKTTVLAAIAAPATQAYNPTDYQMDQFYGATPDERNDRLGIVQPQAAIQTPTITQPDYSGMSQASLDRMDPSKSASMTDKLKGWWNSLQEKPVAYDGKGAPVMGSSQLDTSSSLMNDAFKRQKQQQDVYELENQRRANQSASQGPQMLDMIHKIYGANTAAQQRSSALSALAGR